MEMRKTPSKHCELTETRTPHKHAEVIKKWADGHEIEYKSPHTDSWTSFVKGTLPTWWNDWEFRVKPEIKYVWMALWKKKLSCGAEQFSPQKTFTEPSDQTCVTLKLSGWRNATGWIKVEIKE